MCGRFTLTTVGQQLKAFFPLLDDLPTATQRYNIAPTQNVLVVRDAAEKDAKPQAAWMRWGLIPSWAKEKKIGAGLINARADGVETKPAFAPRSNGVAAWCSPTVSMNGKGSRA